MAKVFISYSNESVEHAAKVLHLAQWLRDEGLECEIDQLLPTGPRGGWPRWMQRQVEEANYVLVVCTETYKRRFEGKEQPEYGSGADWEGILVLQQLYESHSLNDKFIPVLFENAVADNIPLPLRPYTHYQVPRDSERLYRHLTGQPKVVPRPVGTIRPLPPDP
jgi:SEFIR domain-containing protein